jgi:hypothetical protein
MRSITPFEHHSNAVANVPLPEGFISLENHPILNNYDESLNQIFKKLSVFRPDELSHLSDASKRELQLVVRELENKFKHLYQDDDLYRRTRILIKDLTTDRTMHTPREAILDTFKRLRTPAKLAKNDHESQTLFTWISSHNERWERLLSSLGQPQIVPQGVRLYRGVQDEKLDQYIPKVLKAWMMDDDFKVQQFPLASWAFHAAPAITFAHDFGKCENGVVLGADVPLQQIQMDKLTDGGSFLFWWNQYEAIVGSLDPVNSPILANPYLTTVLYQGNWYTHLDKHELNELMNAK